MPPARSKKKRRYVCAGEFFTECPGPLSVRCCAKHRVLLVNKELILFLNDTIQNSSRNKLKWYNFGLPGPLNWRIKYYQVSQDPVITMVIFKSAEGAALAHNLSGKLLNCKEVSKLIDPTVHFNHWNAEDKHMLFTFCAQCHEYSVVQKGCSGALSCRRRPDKKKREQARRTLRRKLLRDAPHFVPYERKNINRKRKRILPNRPINPYRKIANVLVLFSDHSIPVFRPTPMSLYPTPISNSVGLNNFNRKRPALVPPTR